MLSQPGIDQIYDLSDEKLGTATHAAGGTVLRTVGSKWWHQTYPTAQMADSLPRTDTREQFAGADLFEAVPSHQHVKCIRPYYKGILTNINIACVVVPNNRNARISRFPWSAPFILPLFYLCGWLCSHTTLSLQCRPSTESKGFAARTASIPLICFVIDACFLVLGLWLLRSHGTCAGDRCAYHCRLAWEYRRLRGDHWMIWTSKVFLVFFNVL